MSGLEIFAAFMTVGSTLKASSEQRKARSAERRQMEAQRRIAGAKESRERLQAARRARAARAEIVAGGEAAGAGGASSVTAGAGGQQTGFAQQMSFLDTVGAEQETIFQEGLAASRASSRAATVGAIGSLSGQMTDWKSVGAKLRKAVK